MRELAEEGDSINTAVINALKIVIIIGVLAIIYLLMSPDTNDGASYFSNTVFLALAAFGAVTIVRLLISSRRHKK